MGRLVPPHASLHMFTASVTAAQTQCFFPHLLAHISVPQNKVCQNKYVFNIKPKQSQNQDTMLHKQNALRRIQLAKGLF